jgi:hypothetical protein
MSYFSEFRSRQRFQFLGKEEEYRVKLQILRKVETRYGNLRHKKTSKQNPQANIWQQREQWRK